MSKEELTIEGNTIHPGEHKSQVIRIARLPSGHDMEIYAHIFRGQLPGPCILLLGGLHGDEVNGVEIVRRMVTSTMFKGLNCGSIIAIPLLNVYGFINFSRDLSDGKDVNRSFPGNFKGSLASRIARTITKKIMPEVDLLIDFHTGGSSRYNYPQIRHSSNDEQSLALAKIFGAPCTLVKDPISRSLRQFCFKEEIACLVYEGGQSLHLDEYSIMEAISGVERIMLSFAMIDGETKQKSCFYFEKASWVRAQVSGIFKCLKKSGQLTEMNELIGELYDPYGLKKTEVRANRDGFILAHNNSPVVHQGDALFNIGYQWEEYKSEV